MAELKYEVIISDEAKRILGKHIRFVAQENKKVAIKKKDDIIKAIRSLEEYMPQRFPFMNEPYIPPNKYHKMFVSKYYLLIYQIKDSTVYVEYIIDCRQDYSWLLM